MRDSNIADATLLFPFAQSREMRMDIDQVMHLHQIDSLGAQKGHRTFHRFDPALLAVSPDCRCEKKVRHQTVTKSQARCKIADHCFRATIHWRRIIDPAAKYH